MKSYKQKNYEQGLIETYLKFDELLRLEKVDQFLKEYQKNSKNPLDITFSSAVNQENIIEKKETYDSDKIYNQKELQEIMEYNIPKSKRGSKELKQQNIKMMKTPKENIIDLTKKTISSIGSLDSKPKSEDKSSSKEFFTLGEVKGVEVSLRQTHSQNTESNESFNNLIAKDMGTTANILLIKNNYLYLANVGDSMAVLFKNGQAVRLNQEHKTSLQSEFSRIGKSGAKIINNRIEGRLNLTRAIGKQILLIT
jgi:hypothetical protein